MKPKIIFAHATGGQFRQLHDYLNSSGLAASRLLCTKVYYDAQTETEGLIPFPAPSDFKDKPERPRTWARIEYADRLSRGIAGVLLDSERKLTADVIVGHAVFGSLMALFGRTRVPLVSYVEFPSFRAHGWDTRYPPDTQDLIADNHFEMLTWYVARKSARTVCPSQYAKSMFPQDLQSRIEVQMEGFTSESPLSMPRPPLLRSDCRYIGFAARDLSSAKGFDQFVSIAKVLSARSDVNFVAIGATDCRYGFEHHHYSGSSFADHAIRESGLDRSRLLMTGFLAPREYEAYLEHVDVFLYPLQFGVGNWGLFELMRRGKAIVASDRCFIPEVLQDGVNALIREYGNTEAWVSATESLLNSQSLMNLISIGARTTFSQFTISAVAQRYMSILERVMAEHV